MNKVWRDRFFQMAQYVAKWSKDPERKVGCVLVDVELRAASFGYNGFPIGITDDDRLLGLEKNEHCVHAELNAILNARRNLTGWYCFITAPPCHECCKAIIQAGISTVYCPQVEQSSSWCESQQLGLNLLIESAVHVNHISIKNPFEYDDKGPENNLMPDESGDDCPCSPAEYKSNLATQTYWCGHCGKNTFVPLD